jgi:hypothetical protein
MYSALFTNCSINLLNYTAMFIAKFQQTTGSPFKQDKNGNYPFIGTVLAGVATGTIINGTMFMRDGLIPNALYLCENSVDEQYPDSVKVEIISIVPLLDFAALRTQLGAPKINTHQPTEAVVKTAEAEETEVV